MSENKLLDELSSDEEPNVGTAPNMETTEDDCQLNLHSDTKELNAALSSEIETDDEDDVFFERVLERVRARRRAAQDTDEEDLEEATKDALERPSLSAVDSENLDHVADLDPLEEDNDPNSAATDLDLGSEFDFTHRHQVTTRI
ncbi:hypothetical protein WMY93_008109 [Mugilogobius chulae]|uniref:Uncharacterized protein n=1 Tax=Mugilogobius chulae TaxID=88201 RepID=A0AAW0PTL6_9GOBI